MVFAAMIVGEIISVAGGCTLANRAGARAL